MKRLRHRPTPELLQPKKQLPMAEGIIPLDKRGLRNWAAMNDGEVVAHTQKVMREQGVATRGELAKADAGLYFVLRKRKLLDKVGFEKKRRDWAAVGDEEIVSHATKFIEEKGIKSRFGLQKADEGLYEALRLRKLLDRLEFERGMRSWASLSDEQVIDYARKRMEEEGIRTKTGLGGKDQMLYRILRERKILDRLRFEAERSHGTATDERLVAQAREFIEEKGIRYRSELEKANPWLYDALRKRKLLDRAGLGYKIRKPRKWASLSDEEIVEHARRFAREKKISTKKELEHADPGLYEVLRMRKLFGRAGFENMARTWATLSDDEIVEHVKGVLKKSGMRKRNELRKADQSLYQVLRRRNLLEKVGFETKERKPVRWDTVSDDELLGRARSFMAEKGLTGRMELCKAYAVMYHALRERGLLDRVGFEEKRGRQRDWNSLSDDELVAHAKKFMEERGLRGKKELDEADAGLYTVLKRRGLQDRVFGPMENEKRRRAAQEVFDGLKEFGDKE